MTTTSCPSAAGIRPRLNISSGGFPKNFYKLLVCGLLIFYSGNAMAQTERTITGRVNRGKTEPLEGATLVVNGGSTGTKTDKDGKFTLSFPDSCRSLITSFIGYANDTALLASGKSDFQIVLRKSGELNEIVVRDKLKKTEIGLLNTIKTEKIGQAELYKAACCNLGQSFETTPSIDVSFTDAVTGYRQIRLLGLAGTYTLITQENIPLIRGLASVTGLSYTPGSWMEGMQLSKGTGSVVNGFESTAGQINVELKKPFSGETLFFNLYQSSQGSSQAGLVYQKSITPSIGTVLMVDGTSQWLKVDLNKDHFIDQPIGNQLNLLNRWIFTTTNGWMFQAGVKGLYAHGVGGDWNYNEGDPQTLGNPWGYVSTTQRLEDWAKIAKVFNREETSIGLQLANVNHNQQSMYGLNTYSGIQHNFYANLIFQTYIGNTKNIIKTGISEVFDDYNEQVTQATIAQTYLRTENVPGIFAEYATSITDKFNIEAGLRGDYNNYSGAFVTPRLHLRYAPFKRTAIRASIGRAQRTANVFADNIGYMASNRQIDIQNPVPGMPYGLNPEVSWNTGINLTHKFKYRYHEGVFTIDYYYTWFTNQVVVDVNYPEILNFYNLQGRSYSNSFQAQFDYELIRRLNVRLAYRYFDVKTTYYELGLQQKPFVPPHRAFVNLDYETKNKWKFDVTAQWLSSQRTPFATHNHGGTGSGLFAYSAAFYQFNAQITKVFSEKFEAYLGCDNITNFMQHDAIVDYASPYSRAFDASLIWGPMMGVNVYSGLRYRMK